MKRTTAIAVCLLAIAGLYWFAQAGDLEPPGPPAPTMKTLDEVEPRTPISTVPHTITQSGSYFLTGDLTAAATAITIEADHVTVDLMGFSLTGPDSGSNDGIHMSDRINVEIRNGTIRDFEYGIRDDGRDAEQHRIIGVRAISNGLDGIRLEGGDHLVEGCDASENGGSGVSVATGSRIVESIATGNDVYGIDADSQSSVMNNLVRGNGFGIKAGQRSFVIQNTVASNQGSGISADEAGTVMNNSVTRNNLSGNTNAAGISVGARSLVKGNSAVGNHENNIRVGTGIGYTGSCVENNLVEDSENGIYFVSSGNFFANNRASDNTTDYAGSVPTGSADGGGNASF